MARILPFQQYRHRRPRPRKAAAFSPSGVTIFNLAMLTFLAVWFWPNQLPDVAAPQSMAVASTADTEMARFGLCHSGGGSNCVVDGDTFHYSGQKIRIADIDTPETHPARCAEEQRLGDAATARLHALLNAGAFSLETIDRDEDAYGRKLRRVTRGGQSLGGQLVREGLARYYQGGRRPWC
jgi:endonuclease YncB( thermonuclease family)